jgi:DNA-binding transcriptional LysR family regulator
MVKPTQSALIARKIGVVHIGMHAHPRYLKTHGAPRTMDELRRHPFIGFDTAASVRRLPSVGFPLSRELFSYRCDSDVGQYAALRAGFGIGLCQFALGKRDGLVKVMPGTLEFELGIWVVMHKDLKSTRRMRLMFDHLAIELGRYVASE